MCNYPLCLNSSYTDYHIFDKLYQQEYYLLGISLRRLLRSKISATHRWCIMSKKNKSRKGSDIIDIHHFVNEGNILIDIVLNIYCHLDTD